MLNMYAVYWVAVFKAFLQQFFGVKSQKGVTMIEYGLIAALVAIVVIATLGPLGTALQNIFSTIKTKVEGAGQ
ncbi:MAG: Flp family type IVb pilin [Chlorobaculum sp.]